MATDISKYRQNLFDIKKRVEVISEHLQGIRNTKYLITEVEFLCLQFRKVLELIALSSLIANKDEYSKVHEKFAKHYNARLIFQDLERINPEFYPIPSEQKLKMVDGKKVYDLEIINENYLTKEDFLLVYEKCGGLLHAENPYGHKRDLKAIKLEFPVWKDKIIVLLNHHSITLVDNETLIIGLMEGKGDGLPYAFEFKKLNDTDANSIKEGMK